MCLDFSSYVNFKWDFLATKKRCNGEIDTDRHSSSISILFYIPVYEFSTHCHNNYKLYNLIQSANRKLLSLVQISLC